MDLYLHEEDLKKVFKKIEQHYQMFLSYGGGTLFANKYWALDTDNMEFGCGAYDSALFYHHHPMDAEDYNQLSVRSVYEELVLLKKQRTKEDDIIYEKFGEQTVINIGRMIEKREEINDSIRNNEFESKKPICTSVDNVKDQLEKIGFKIEVSDFLQRKIQEGVESFTKIENVQIEGNTARAKLHFGVLQNGLTDLKSYDLQLLHKTSINHKVVNGVDTRKLEEEMRKVDWYYEIAESMPGMIKGYKNVERIKSNLEKICEDRDNGILAVQLWNNNVPIDAGIGKPEFIVKAETGNSLYPYSNFSRETTLSDAYKELNGIANLEIRMKNADWYFEYSDDHSVWQKGVNEIDGIKKDLQSLSKLPMGLERANELWQKYVPPASVSKPCFLTSNDTKENLGQAEVAPGQSSETKRPGFLKQTSLRQNQKRRMKPK